MPAIQHQVCQSLFLSLLLLLLISFSGKAMGIANDSGIGLNRKDYWVRNAHPLPIYTNSFYDSSLTDDKLSNLQQWLGNSWSISAATIFNRQSIGSIDIARTYGFYAGCEGIFGRSYGLGLEQNLRHVDAKSMSIFLEGFVILTAVRLEVLKDISVHSTKAAHPDPWRIRLSMGLTGIYYGDIMLSYTFSTVQNDPYRQGFGITFRARMVYKRSNWDYK